MAALQCGSRKVRVPLTQRGILLIPHSSSSSLLSIFSLLLLLSTSFSQRTPRLFPLSPVLSVRFFFLSLNDVTSEGRKVPSWAPRGSTRT